MEKILRNYVDTFNTADSKRFADLFDTDCIFKDSAPTVMGMDPIYIDGRECVNLIFNSNFNTMNNRIELIEIRNNEMDYNVIIMEQYVVPCHGVLEEVKYGKISKYTVTPRKDEA